MASIFDDIDRTIRETFRLHGKYPPGQNHCARSYYTTLCELISQNRAKSVELISDILQKCYINVNIAIECAEIRGIHRMGSRGVLRAKTILSDARSKATFLRMEDFEQTLERTIVRLQRDKHNKTHEWFNQFNVASGVMGTRGDSKTAIDIVRRSFDDSKRLDIIELKEWDSGNHPLHALLEIFRYCCAVLILGKEDRDPDRPNRKWPGINSLRMFILAPDKWYSEFDRDGKVDNVVQVFHEALEAEKDRTGSLYCCSFFSSGLVLRGLTKSEFVDSFYGVTDGQESYSYNNMDRTTIDRLIGWVDGAFIPADGPASPPRKRDDSATDSSDETSPPFDGNL
jgi:hypothetical protein